MPDLYDKITITIVEVISTVCLLPMALILVLRPTYNNHTIMQLYGWPWQIILTNQAFMLYSYAGHYALDWALFYASLTGLEFN